MARMKEYMMELSEKLGKDFEEITQEDFEREMKLDELKSEEKKGNE